MKRLLLLATAVILVSGWDTSENHETQWASAYVVDVPQNEHTAISDTILRAMGADIMAVSGDSDEMWNVTDLNANLFRRSLHDAFRAGDDPNTTLEERDLPSPAHFTGLPDYSWTLYDWMNKNSVCPAIPLEAQTFAGIDVCHAFKGWLGSLNAVHFGSQAELMYEHLHAVAVKLAERAAGLRTSLTSTPEGKADFGGFVREAELEALSYEANAQHFLQDRWSSGHGWERWNASSYELLPEKDLPTNFLVAALSGVIHGAQSVAEIPDPLCSPVVDANGVTPISWSHETLGIHPGVGDYHWFEIAGSGEGSFLEQPYQVEVQYRQLMECGKRGYAEVIRAFGANGDGTYGEWETPLDDNAPAAGLSATAPECGGAWATNEAMKTGWQSVISSDLATAARLVLTLVFGELTALDRVGVTRLGWKLDWAAYFDPAGTTMARGGLGTLAGVEPGDEYVAIPTYAEPLDFDTLPEDDIETGRDKRTIYGFFNRAHADHWCDATRFKTIVEPLRGSPVVEDQLVCAYLAERMYRGTDPDYTRYAEGRQGTSAFPACHYLGTTEDGDTDDGIPYFVHPGYLDQVSATTTIGTGAADPEVLETLANWCARIPVIDVDAEDVAASALVGPAGVTTSVSGMNFGTTEGSVELSFGQTTVSATVTSWTNALVEFTVPVAMLPDPLTDAVITLIRDDGLTSVGERFVQLSLTPTVTNIGDIDATDLNNAGQVLGQLLSTFWLYTPGVGLEEQQGNVYPLFLTNAGPAEIPMIPDLLDSDPALPDLPPDPVWTWDKWSRSGVIIGSTQGFRNYIYSGGTTTEIMRNADAVTVDVNDDELVIGTTDTAGTYGCYTLGLTQAIRLPADSKYTWCLTRMMNKAGHIGGRIAEDGGSYSAALWRGAGADALDLGPAGVIDWAAMSDSGNYLVGKCESLGPCFMVSSDNGSTWEYLPNQYDDDGTTWYVADVIAVNDNGQVLVKAELSQNGTSTNLVVSAP
jgi:hypothetical protein